MRRSLVLAAASIGIIITPTAAMACGGLIGPRGSVNLLKTTTLAGYHNGVEHYVTSFSFAGPEGGQFGSITPLPGIPSKVERGGDWTLQRLLKETQPPVRERRLDSLSAASAAQAPAQVILRTRIDALDLTVLKGGGTEVGLWAKQNGFQLPVDSPEVLDFYANRSPIFLAAKFDADAARARGQLSGDGTPIHISIPTREPWVPLRILALGKQSSDLVNADVYLLTDAKPRILTGDTGTVAIRESKQASDLLLKDLRSDKGMGWIPPKMWFSYIAINGPAGDLTSDLALNVHGLAPSRVDAGLSRFAAAFESPVIPGRGTVMALIATVLLGIAVIARTKRGSADVA